VTELVTPQIHKLRRRHRSVNGGRKLGYVLFPTGLPDVRWMGPYDSSPEANAAKRSLAKYLKSEAKR